MRLGARTRASALEALGYAKGVPPLDMEHKAFRECVVWLEDTKIRATAMASRGPLRLIEAKDWVASFAALARETGCSVDASSDSQTSLVFDHLVSTAVALDYRDDADVLGAVVKTLRLGTAGKPVDTQPGAKRQRVDAPHAAASFPSDVAQTRPTMENMDGPGLRVKLVTLAIALDIDADAVMRLGGGDRGGGVEALTRTIALAVGRFVAPFWDAVERGEKHLGEKLGKGTNENAMPRWNLSPHENFPPGMDLAPGTSETVRDVVAVLRVLHVNDMRGLQTAVDALLVRMQEHTSDPKTDSALGKVGRG